MAKFLPLSLVLATALGILEVLCVFIGLIAIVVGSFVSAFQFSQIGKKNDFKKQFVLTELQRTFTDVVYEPRGELPYPIIADTRLLDNGNRYRSNDYICAKYRGILFEQGDVLVENVSQSSGDQKTSVTLCFQGRWLVLKMAKTIQGEFFIFNRQFPLSQEVRRKNNSLEVVVTEDSVFNDAFSTRATNPHDVFYMFTPILIDKLKGFVGLHSGEPILNGIGLYCRGNRIHVAVSGMKDAFESGIIEIDSEQQIQERLRAEISLITDIIEALA